MFFFFFFFFFQAEDGIRDADVTGVQTCALPISPRPLPATERGRRSQSTLLAPPLRFGEGAGGGVLLEPLTSKLAQRLRPLSRGVSSSGCSIPSRPSASAAVFLGATSNGIVPGAVEYSTARGARRE